MKITTYKLDVDKIQDIEDVKKVLRFMGINFKRREDAFPDSWDEIEPLCVETDSYEDGQPSAGNWKDGFSIAPPSHESTTKHYRSIAKASVSPCSEPNMDNFSLLTINSDEKLGADDIGKFCGFEGFTGAYICHLLDDKRAVLSWHPVDYAKYQGVSCEMRSFKERL